MDANRAELELKSGQLRNQLASFQSELETLRSRVQEVTSENEILRRDLRRTIDERLSGIHPDTVFNSNHESMIELQRNQLQLLEQEKDDALKLCEQSRQMIAQLEQEVNDLKDPLKPYLIKIDMQTKQAQEEHARVEVELMQEINIIREELSKRSRELVNSQLHVKEIERQNETLQAEIYQKQDDLRNHLKKEIGYDGTFVAFQSSIDALEVRLEHALKEKENSKQQHDEIESKLKDLTQQNRSLQEKLIETTDQLQHYVHLRASSAERTSNDHEYDRQENYQHEQMHRTIDELIEQAAVKTRTAVEEVRQQYNDNLEKLMQEYNEMETELNRKQAEFDKCLRAKRSAEEELDKILQERRLNIDKSALTNEDLARRCFQAERDRDDAQLKLEQSQQAHKMTQQNFEADKVNHALKQKELSDRLTKVSHDLDTITREHMATLNELNELKKKLSSIQNEQTLAQRRTTELVKRHEEQMIEKEKECLIRLTQRDEVNRTTFNELRNLVNRQQRMIVKYKEECHTIASQSESKINELKQKIDNLRSRNEQLQSDVGDVKRKEADINRILALNTTRMKTLEERLHDAEEQAVEASRRVAKQFVRDRLAITHQNDHYPYASLRPTHSTSLFNLSHSTPRLGPPTTDSNDHLSDGK